MSNTYKFANADGTQVVRSDGVLLFWSKDAAAPSDTTGLVGRTWQNDGSPVPSPYVAPVATPPDSPTLGDWRVALRVWGRMDAVTARVAALVASSDPDQAKLGGIADERLQYSNNVYRAQLMSLKDALGFTAAEVDESLWRAAQIAKGDYSGTWPLPSNPPANSTS